MGKSYQNFFSKSGKRYLGMGNAEEFFKDVKVGDRIIGSAIMDYVIKIDNKLYRVLKDEEIFFLGIVIGKNDDFVRLYCGKNEENINEIIVGRNAWRKIKGISIL